MVFELEWLQGGDVCDTWPSCLAIIVDRSPIAEKESGCYGRCQEVGKEGCPGQDGFRLLAKGI